nr:unnamed protein product [Rangifer tarandus platyrhynchus]
MKRSVEMSRLGVKCCLDEIPEEKRDIRAGWFALGRQVPSERCDPSPGRDAGGDPKSWVAAFTLSLSRQLIHLPPTCWKVPASSEIPAGGRLTSCAPSPPEEPGHPGNLGLCLSINSVGRTGRLHMWPVKHEPPTDNCSRP